MWIKCLQSCDVELRNHTLSGIDLQIYFAYCRWSLVHDWSDKIFSVGEPPNTKELYSLNILQIPGKLQQYMTIDLGNAGVINT